MRQWFLNFFGALLWRKYKLNFCLLLRKQFLKILTETSVADPGPGSGAFLTPGSEIRDPEKTYSGSLIPDPGSQIHIFESLVTIF